MHHQILIDTEKTSRGRVSPLFCPHAPGWLGYRGSFCEITDIISDTCHNRIYTGAADVRKNHPPSKTYKLYTETILEKEVYNFHCITLVDGGFFSAGKQAGAPPWWGSGTPPYRVLP
jgi:hypothetical protein